MKTNILPGYLLIQTSNIKACSVYTLHVLHESYKSHIAPLPVAVVLQM